MHHLSFAEVLPQGHVGQGRLLSLHFEQSGFNGILDDELDRRYWSCLPESMLRNKEDFDQKRVDIRS
jgi:hypothetical protein